MKLHGRICFIYCLLQQIKPFLSISGFNFIISWKVLGYRLSRIPMLFFFREHINEMANLLKSTTKPCVADI